MKRFNPYPLAMFLIALAPAIIGCGGGSGVQVTVPATSVPLPEMIEASHNRFVGTFTANSKLPDGRAARFDLYTYPDSKFSLYALVDGVRTTGNGKYDIRNGMLTSTAAVLLADGKTTLATTSGLPYDSSTALGIAAARYDEPTKPPTYSTIYVTFKRRSPAPLGDDRILRVTDLSIDCNADPKADRFEFVQSNYNVPYTKQGDFSMNGALVQAANAKKAFNFFLFDLVRNDADPLVRVGGRADFKNGKARFSYFEYPSDGTIHQWTAVSGTLVFDAIDPTGANYSIGGTDFESDAGVTFHLENVRMQPLNVQGENTQFKGANGSFTANFSGTTTVGYKKASR